jgi:hypothetical protein
LEVKLRDTEEALTKERQKALEGLHHKPLPFKRVKKIYCTWK